MIKLRSLAFQILDIDIEEEEDYDDGIYRRRPRRRRRYGYWVNEELEDDSSDMEERGPRR